MNVVATEETVVLFSVFPSLRLSLGSLAVPVRRTACTRSELTGLMLTRGGGGCDVITSLAAEAGGLCFTNGLTNGAAAWNQENETVLRMNYENYSFQMRNSIFH